MPVPQPPNNFQNITESWNGTNWSNVASMNTDRAYFGGCGTGTAGLAFGGQQSTADTAATEEWDGTGFITKTITTTTVSYTHLTLPTILLV